MSVHSQASRLDVRGFPGLSWGPGEKAGWVYVSGKLLDGKLAPGMGQQLFPECTDSRLNPPTPAWRDSEYRCG